MTESATTLVARVERPTPKETAAARRAYRSRGNLCGCHAQLSRNPFYSGVVRHFELPDSAAATASAKTKNGSGISVDALIPVIPATPESKGNSLTLLQT